MPLPRFRRAASASSDVRPPRRRALARTVVAGLALGAALAAPSSAEAFSTRVHIMLANRILEAVADGGGSIELWQGGYAVQLDEDDARALLAEPEAFRAGAIGPDNMIMPGLTDPSHALHQRPYEQCQLLYEAAVVDKERAYALGCFLHGSTDAIAHQYVNYMTGETFTLNPVSHGREESLSNVIRHMVAEDMIQDAAHLGDPEAFTGEALAHEIPTGFVLRTYFSRESPLHAVMAAEAYAKFDAALAEDPQATLAEVILGLDGGPADHFVLLPLYVERIHDIRVWLRAALLSEIQVMQDWDSEVGATLQVLPGPDGAWGTRDDETACDVGCSDAFVRYFVYVGLMEPRHDAGGNELPSAFDKVSDKLGDDVDDLPPTLLDVIQNVSTALNGGLDEGGGGLGDLDAGAVQELFAPLSSWASRTTTIDSQAIAAAVSPGWMMEMDVFFQSFGLSVDLAGWVEALLDPVVQPIRDGIQVHAINRAKDFVTDLSSGYAAQRVATEDEYLDRLSAAMPPELGAGTFLDRFYDTGLFGHSFNITAAAFGNHAAVLPVSEDEGGLGPASFDCSHTASWMQASLCDYLRPVVFPLGEDAAGAVSILDEGEHLRSLLPGDSPIECHEGSLFAFSSSPDVASCELTTLAALASHPHGSVSRAYPPHLSGHDVGCENIVIPGLPLPPDATGTGGGGGDGGSGDASSGVGPGSTSSASASGSPGAGGAAQGDGDGDGGHVVDDDGEDDGTTTAGAEGDDEGGCACRAAPSPAGDGPLAALALGVVVAAARRRRRIAAVCTAVLGLASAACSDDAASGAAGTGGAATGQGGSAAGGDAGGTAAGGGDGGASGTASAPSSSTATATTSASSSSAGDGGSGPIVGSGGGGAGDEGGGDGTGGGGNGAEELLAVLAGTTWSGLAEEDGRERAFELSFAAGEQRWALVRNPFGPARVHAGGDFVVEDGSTIRAVDDATGDVHVWSVVVDDRAPRVLHVDGAAHGLDLGEGAWPVPDQGLTAEVRVFASSGDVADAYCKAGSCGMDYDLLFAFARGEDVETDLGRDVVAGSRLGRWFNVDDFAVTDVDGFDFETLGGTELSDQYNFVVRYTGWVEHPGGLLSMREQDDDVGELNPTDYGGVWAFLGADVGVGGFDELFLGVNAFALARSDGSPDEPLATAAQGFIPVEIVLVRCNTDGPAVDVEMSIDEGEWLPVGDQPTVPDVSTDLFPLPL